MIKFLQIICIVILFSSCEEQEMKAYPTNKSQGVVTGTYGRVLTLNEFQYKGHTYISCDVRDGISLTHAGHCPCNKK
jgi:hypothetical protein